MLGHTLRMEDGNQHAVVGVAVICHTVLGDFSVTLGYSDGGVEVSGENFGKGAGKTLTHDMERTLAQCTVRQQLNGVPSLPVRLAQPAG